MPLLKPSEELEKITINIDRNLGQEIESYCQWVGIKKIDEFFEQAAKMVLHKDSDWKAFRKPKK